MKRKMKHLLLAILLVAISTDVYAEDGLSASLRESRILTITCWYHKYR